MTWAISCSVALCLIPLGLLRFLFHVSETSHEYRKKGKFLNLLEEQKHFSVIWLKVLADHVEIVMCVSL